MEKLPVATLREPIFSALDAGVRRLVVSAPTGSGKSTSLPVMLSEKLGGTVYVLQPRRVAARMLARSVERLFSMERRVGWHVRFDKHYDSSSRIVFLTEGILARMLIADPSLRGASAVVFDEFHERNIYADLSLALALRTQKALRPDLTVVVCSASMDAAALSAYLGSESRAFSCGGRLFDIETRYAPPRDAKIPVWETAAAQFASLARESEEGNFLIFMPGAYEISRTVSHIMGSPSAKGFDVLSLHGDLPPREQDAVLAAGSRRKVIVSTNVAETSLTIEGVRYVIDSGLAKVARFDPSRGVNTLLVERESLASAAQRAGRSGRTAAGVAVRLWRQADEMYFEKYSAPEISRLDLSQSLLWLKSAGLDFETLGLFEKPSDESARRAEETLRSLGALDAHLDITATGRDMARFPAEPRMARLLLEGARRGVLDSASLIAALSDVGRIKLPVDNPYDSAARDEMVGDVLSEPEELAKLCLVARENSFAEDFCRRYGIHAANSRKALVIAADFARLGKKFAAFSDGADDPRALAKCVLSAFSDRLCVRLNKGTLWCRLSKGRRGEIRRESKAYAENLFAAMELEERNTTAGVSILASMLAPVEKEDLRELFPDDFSVSTSVSFDAEHRRVVARAASKFRDFVLEEKDSADVPRDEAAKILRDEIVSGRLALKNWDESCDSFVARVNFAAAVSPESGIAAIDGAAKAEIFEQMCFGASSYSDVKNADVLKALRDWLSREQLSLLDWLVPKTADMPRRRNPAYVRYELNPPRAVVSSYFKDFFDFNEKSLSICGGKIAPTYEILAPNSRPVQTTCNLAEFWKTSWLQIKKEMKMRYPKHFKEGDKY